MAMTLDFFRQHRHRPLVILDTETTGFYHDRGDEIIELAAERVEHDDVVDRFHAIIQASLPIPPEATAVHGMDDDYVATHGKNPEEVYPAFAAFAGDAVLVGHNIRRFDFPFLLAQYARLGLPPLTNDLFDTLELSRALLQLPNHKLGTIASHFAIPTAGAHRAAADVAMTREILKRFSNLV